MEQFSPSVEDSLCIGQRRPRDGSERVLLFVKMRPGEKLTEGLRGEIRSAIRNGLSARHIPEVIAEVPDIPVGGHVLFAQRCDMICYSTR